MVVSAFICHSCGESCKDNSLITFFSFQACIDDNLDMVEFLVEQGADINRADNEGWTPLHATSSCG